jgi:hypothetical protein
MEFPLWQLYPARVAFTVIRLFNSVIRLFIKKAPQ